jgi:hypothetical protein
MHNAACGTSDASLNSRRIAETSTATRLQASSFVTAIPWGERWRVKVVSASGDLQLLGRSAISGAYCRCSAGRALRCESRAMIKHDKLIDGRETGFLHSLNRGCHLSTKQLAVVDRIVQKVARFSCG